MVGKGSFASLITLIRPKSLIIQNVTGIFMMLNTIIENENKIFANILIFFLES